MNLVLKHQILSVLAEQLPKNHPKHVTLTMLELLKLILELGTLDDTVNMQFEMSGCMDAVENLQYDNSDQVYSLARRIIKSYNAQEGVQNTL